MKIFKSNPQFDAFLYPSMALWLCLFTLRDGDSVHTWTNRLHIGTLSLPPPASDLEQEDSKHVSRSPWWPYRDCPMLRSHSSSSPSLPQAWSPFPPHLGHSPPRIQGWSGSRASSVAWSVQREQSCRQPPYGSSAFVGLAQGSATLS